MSGYLTSYFDHEVQQSQLNQFLTILGSTDKNLNNGFLKINELHKGASSGGHESTGTLPQTGLAYVSHLMFDSFYSTREP